MPTNGKMIYAINKYSLEIYDGIVKKTITVEDIYDLIKNKGDIESLHLKKISNVKIKKIEKQYDKVIYLDDILYIMRDRYSHLRGIRHIVNINDLLDYIIPEDIFIEKIRISYTIKIINKLLDKYYDHDSAKLFSKLLEELNRLDDKLNVKIIKKINEYYVRKITV